MEVVGKAAAKLSEFREEFTRPGPLPDLEHARTGDVDLDVVALSERQRLDHGGGKANGKAVTPFCDLHGNRPVLDIRATIVYQFHAMRVRSRALHRRRGDIELRATCAVLVKFALPVGPSITRNSGIIGEGVDMSLVHT